MKTAPILLAAMLVLASCGIDNAPKMTKEESRLINESPEVFRILSVDNDSDLAVLRTPSVNFNVRDLKSAEYQSLAAKLVRTLESTDGGVGLAAPQMGINRRVVAVQRVDKEGEPIEVYPNIRIVEFRGEKEAGREGCLSVPDKAGSVLRYRDITIVYTDIHGAGTLRSGEITEDVSGFAAVIFQHEVDHLDGVLYTDKCVPVEETAQSGSAN